MKILYVYRAQDMETENQRPIWFAPFKTDAELVAAIMERQNLGFVFTVKDEPKKIKMTFTMTQLEPDDFIYVNETYGSLDDGKTVGKVENKRFRGTRVKDHPEYTFWKLDVPNVS